MVQPERYPGDDNQHAARDVDLDQVVTELSFKQKVDFKATVFTCNISIIVEQRYLNNVLRVIKLKVPQIISIIKYDEL